MRAASVPWLVVLTIGGGGCLRETRHQCTSALECGVNGVCEPSGFCSFADVDCDGGRRYGDGAGELAGACVGGLDPDAPDPPMIDAAIDGGVDLVAHVPADAEQPGTMAWEPDDGTLDTTALTWRGASQPWLTLLVTDQGNEVALARVDRFFVGGGKRVTVEGARPLIIVARDVELDGTLDASAKGNEHGPGGGGMENNGGDGASDQPDHGGGGGGGYGTAGGAGGHGGDANASGGMAGPALGDGSITLLVGGPGGGAGGTPCTGSAGGGGGGAIQIYASERLRVDGTIEVGGGGGRGNGNCSAGGGGGGAGGAIYLQSSLLIEVTGRLVANGGSGAGGGGLGAGGNGNDGQVGTNSANGGSAGINSSPGGDGGSIAAPPEPGGDSDFSGGGGGGAVGRIVTRAPTVSIDGNAILSPLPYLVDD